MVNWNKVFVNGSNVTLFQDFVLGKVSGRELQRRFRGSSLNTQIRRLMRGRSVTDARRATREALRRRQLVG